MDDSVVIIIGLLVTGFIFGGVILTIIEFRKMGRNPDQYENPTPKAPKTRDRYKDEGSDLDV
jgi:hypothetical protein